MKLNKFQKLSLADQKFVFDLCDQHGYDKAVELLAEDRPVGLNFNTSRASLCRYYSRYHPDAAQYLISAEHAHALQIRHQAADGALTEGTLALVQSRIFESLQKGRPIADMTAEFRIFNQLHRAFLREDAWRRQHATKTQAKYWDYIKSQIFTPDADYVRNDIENDPGVDEDDAHELCPSSTDEQWDIFHARRKQDQLDAAKEAAYALKMQQASAAVAGPAGDPFQDVPAVMPTSEEEIANATPEQLISFTKALISHRDSDLSPDSDLTDLPPTQNPASPEKIIRPSTSSQVENSTSSNPKSPVIPHFSPNSTSTSRSHPRESASSVVDFQSPIFNLSSVGHAKEDQQPVHRSFSEGGSSISNQ